MSDYISEDNLFQILKWLPVKSLLRFRCVSKLWMEVIDSHALVQEHLSVQNPRFIVDCRDPEIAVIDPRAHPLLEFLRSGPFGDETSSLSRAKADRFCLCGTLHGIICVYDDHGKKLQLWNPAIRKFWCLALPQNVDIDWEYPVVVEGCFGFWIDPCSKEFKFIIFQMLFDLVGEDNNKDGDVDGVLYSSVKQDWRIIHLGQPVNWKPLQQGPPPVNVGYLGSWKSYLDGPPVLVGGVAYWAGCYKLRDGKGREHETNVVLSFDFVEESFEFIEMPNLKFLPSIHPRHCHWKGALSLLYWDLETSDKCEVYSMQASSWVKMFEVEVVSLQLFDVLWVLEETEEGPKFLATTGDQLVLYDTRGCCIPWIDRYGYVAYDFVESLLLPNLIAPTDAEVA